MNHREKEAAEEAAARAAEGEAEEEEEEEKEPEPELSTVVLEGLGEEEGVDIYTVRSIGEVWWNPCRSAVWRLVRHVPSLPTSQKYLFPPMSKFC